ncbi:MAG: hypothetical protein V4488_06180 [Pseudomonadota bacterium]
MSKVQTFLAGCTTMAAALAAVFALTAAKAPPNHAHFDEITVGRINIEEPDGTKRLVISNRTQFPGDFFKGKESARPDRASFAGMLFINDEGTENGGLIQKGDEKSDGSINAGLSLTFDRFRQDQALQLLHTDSNKASRTSIRINDLPDQSVASIEDMKKFGDEAAKLPPAERKGYWQRLSDEGKLAQNRIYLGTTGDKASALTLSDAKGKPRMMLLVTAQGQPEIRMLDENGKVTKTVTPGS